MSKASEWADRLKNAKKMLAGVEQDQARTLAFTLPSETLAPPDMIAFVDTDGSPYFEKVRGRWAKYDALALALWIVDTFGDEPTERSEA